MFEDHKMNALLYENMKNRQITYLVVINQEICFDQNPSC